MTFTVDTKNKTISIHGSFTFDEFVNLKQTLLKGLGDGYTFTAPIEKEYVYPPFYYQYTQIPQNPYPLVPYPTTADPYKPPYHITCGPDTPANTTSQLNLFKSE